MTSNQIDIPPERLTGYWCPTCFRFWAPGTIDRYPAGFHYAPRRGRGRCSQPVFDLTYKLVLPTDDGVDIEIPEPVAS